MSRKIVAYFTNWGIYDRNYNVFDIPANKITHINYAFAKVENGLITATDSWADYEKPFGNEPSNAPYLGNFYQLKMLKERFPNLKTLISVGGWALSKGISTMAATTLGRKNFAASCIDFIFKYDFDGIDIDWEFPVCGGLDDNDYLPEDGRNFTLLLNELRTWLNAAEASRNRKYLLTVATSAGVDKIANLDLPGMAQSLDWFNVMAYDFYGSFDIHTNHHAALYPNPADPTPNQPQMYFKAKYNTSDAVQAYLAGGVPAEKIVVGIPFYGRGWDDVPPVNNGLFQRSGGASTIGTWEPAVFDYDDIVANHSGPAGENVFWDDAAKASYIYDAKNRRFISYESIESCSAKMDFINQRNLGGAMFWELSQDRKQDLINIIYQKTQK